MDRSKSFILILGITLCLSVQSCSKIARKAFDGFVWVYAYADSTFSKGLAPQIAGEWVAEDYSRVCFHEDRTVEFYDFIYKKDSLFHRKHSTAEVDSLRRMGYEAWAWHMILSDTISYAAGKWHWDPLYGHISCKSEDLCRIGVPVGTIDFDYRRQLLPPFKIRFIVHFFGDPDEKWWRKFYRNTEETYSPNGYINP